MSYRLIIEATTARLRAEYAPYDTRPEFDEGMKAHAAGIYVCPYDGPGHAGYKAQAWDRGLECAARLTHWFRYDRQLPKFGSLVR